MREVFLFLLGGLTFLGAYFALRHRVLKRGRPLARELSDYLGVTLNQFAILTRPFARIDLANRHLAVEKEAEIRSPGGVVDLTLLGYKLALGEHQNSLRELLVKEKPLTVARIGPVQYCQVEVDVGQCIPCLQNGLYLID